MFALMSFSVKIEFIKSGLNLHFGLSETGKIAENTTRTRKIKYIPRLNNIFDFISGVENIHFTGPFVLKFKSKFFKSLSPILTAWQHQHINDDHEEAHAYSWDFGPEIASRFRRYLLSEQNVVCYKKEKSKAK